MFNLLFDFYVPFEGGLTAPSPFTDFGVLISTVVGAFIIFTALASFIFLILGGFQYITSAGDKVHIQTARDRITYAVLGLIVVAVAGALFSVLGAVFGINIFGTIKWPGP